MTSYKDSHGKIAKGKQGEAPLRAEAGEACERRGGQKCRWPAAPVGRRFPYHHGDLHGALLKAAETVLERDGLAGLTLRAVAREAGVSHAAPTHHFGDLTGLLSELAAIGYRQFSAAMVAARSAGTQPSRAGQAKAYVAYAQAHPGLYGTDVPQRAARYEAAVAA